MDKRSTRLILLCGLPGAGKTTLGKKLAKELDGVGFSPDEWMRSLGIKLTNAKFRDNLEKTLWQLAKQLLKNGQTVILENGFWLVAHREEKIEEARSLGVSVELYLLDPPIEEIKSRLRKRNHEVDSMLLQGKLEEYDKEFERPSSRELKLYDKYTVVD